MKKTVLVLIIITVFSKIFGFARDIILSYFYGASNISDAYLISMTIPIVIFSFVGVGISTGYIPVYSEIVQNHGDKEGNRFTNNLINILIVICSIIIVVSFLFSEQIVRLFASGFKRETLALATQFTRISLISIYFIAIIYVLNSYLQTKGNYTIPALIGFPMNICIILSIFLSKYVDVIVLAVGNVIAYFLQLVFLLPYIYRKGFKYEFRFDINNKYIKEIAFLALPVILGVSVNQINVLVDKTIASRIVVGGISVLNYANRLTEFVQGMFVVTITTVIYPIISKMVAENNVSGLKNTVTEAMNVISLLVIPASMGAMIFAKPIIYLLFARGEFDSQAINLTSYALLFYSVGMIGYGIRQVISRALYSLQDTKTPMINATVGVVLNIILNIILSKYMGIGGLALATSISAIVTTALLLISLRRKIGSFGLKKVFITFIKIIFASLVMGAFSKMVFDYLITIVGQNLSLLISIGIGVIIYFTIIYFMRIQDVDAIIGAIKMKLKKSSV